MAIQSQMSEIPVRTIGMLLDPSSVFARNVHRGIGRWVRQHPEWSTLTVTAPVLKYFAGKGGRPFAGLIGELGNPDLHRLACAVSRCVVSTTRNQPADAAVCVVTNDNRETGRVAARYFFERGWTQVYFCVRHQATYCYREHRDGIREAAKRIGMEFDVRCWSRPEELRPLLRAFPRGAAVIADNDYTGIALIREARVLGIPVPMDLAILGLDDDDLLVETEAVPMSSVRPSYDEIAWRAAELIRTRRVRPGTFIQILPEGVMERKSTDTFAVSDERVRRALALLNSRCSGSVDIQSVAREAGMSRRNMDLLFRRSLKTTPVRWLQRLRVRRAQRLLARTGLPVEEIAGQCGYANTVSFWRAFRRECGMAPGEYRTHCGA
jgi:LacI family transcriptional regulator